jgi:excisionase family DNA binding protein
VIADNSRERGEELAALLKQAEAARILAVSERTLWQLTKQGKIECVRVGRSVRYARAALAAFIQKGGER